MKMSHSLVGVNSFVTNGDKELQCVTTQRRKLSKIPQIQAVENSLKIMILRPNPNPAHQHPAARRSYSMPSTPDCIAQP